MGKEGDFWDDSTLVKAFDNAISKYKVMHGSNAGEKAVTDTEENLPDNGSTEHVQKDDCTLETTAKTGETNNLLQVEENSPLELNYCANCVGSSNTQNGNPLPTNENPAEVQSDLHVQNEATWYSNGAEEYGQLLNKYYEIERQRQNVLQQLNQYSNWNYQEPISNASTSQEYQESVPQPYNTVPQPYDTVAQPYNTVPQPYDIVTCNCPYGCQNWTIPCNTVPASCPGGTCIDQSCKAILKDSPNGNSISAGEPDFVQTAMVAAKTALSSLTKEASSNAGTLANGGKGKELGAEIGHLTESNKAATDLDVVLNAWFSAGFHTGKYLSEQSLEKRKHG